MTRITAHRGIIYLWMIKKPTSVLVAFDPENITFQELFNTSSLDPNHPFSGKFCYPIVMMPDEEEPFLWLGMSDRSDVDGLWQFDLRTRDVTEVPAPFSEINQLSRQADYLLMADGPGEVAALYVPTQDVVPLVGSGSNGAGPMYGQMPALSWPMVWFGSYALTTSIPGFAVNGVEFNDNLTLHTGSRERIFTRTVMPDGKPPAIGWFYWMDEHHALAFARDGRIWRITFTPPPRDPSVSLTFLPLNTRAMKERLGAPLPVAKVDASSQAKARRRKPHSPELAIDGDLITQWGALPDADKEPWLKLTFPQSSTVSRIAIANGASYWSRSYHVPRQVEFESDSGLIISVELQPLNSACTQIVKLPEPVTTSSLTLRIKSTYPAAPSRVPIVMIPITEIACYP